MLTSTPKIIIAGLIGSIVALDCEAARPLTPPNYEGYLAGLTMYSTLTSPNYEFAFFEIKDPTQTVNYCEGCPYPAHANPNPLGQHYCYIEAPTNNMAALLMTAQVENRQIYAHGITNANCALNLFQIE